MNQEENFLHEQNLSESEEIAEVLNSEPEVTEEYPSVGGYDVEELRNAIREARD